MAMRKPFDVLRTSARLVLTAGIVVLCVPGASLAYEKEVKAQAADLAQKISQSGKRTVAVVDFTDLQGNVTELGRFLAEEFSVALAEAGKDFEMVDRTHLKSILTENKLSATGLIDPTTARKLGKLAGVQALVTGTLTPLGETVRLALKFLDVETAKVGVSTAFSIPQTDAIRELLQRGIETVTVSGTGGGTGSRAGRSQQIVESDEISFALQNCVASGATVRCHLLATSKNVDQVLSLASNSRAIDELGNEYYVSQLQIGSRSSGRSARGTLIAGVPTTVSLAIEGIAPEVRKFAVLEIVGSKHKVQFRNVPLSR
jgi:TolB-like protein